VRKQLVLCSYKNDVSWCSEVIGFDIVVYEKGGIKQDIAQANVGREHYTYTKHIVDNYENLADLIVFSQANPFDHQSEFILMLNALPENTKFEAFGNLYINSDRYGMPCTASWIGGIPMERVYRELFNTPYPNVIACYANSIFAASKQRIIKHSKEFYEKMLRMIDYEHTPVEVFCLERFWHIIMSEHQICPKRKVWWNG